MTNISPVSLNLTHLQFFVMVLLDMFLMIIALLIWKKSDWLETVLKKASDGITKLFRKKG